MMWGEIVGEVGLDARVIDLARDVMCSFLPSDKGHGLRRSFSMCNVNQVH